MREQTRLPLAMAIRLALASTGACEKNHSLSTQNLTQGVDAGDSATSGGAGSGGATFSGMPPTGGIVNTGGNAGTGGVVPAGASGASSRDAGINDGLRQCVFGGRYYDLGSTFTMEDGCNTCVCGAEYGPAMFMCTGKTCNTGGASSGAGSRSLGGTSGTSRTSITGGSANTGGAAGTGGTVNTGGAASTAGTTSPSSTTSTGTTSTGGTSGASGSSGTGGVGGASGTGSSSGGCGDPVVMARYDSCMASTTASTCTANGGTWYTGGPRAVCDCPTGQDGCPCPSPSYKCLGYCAKPAGGSSLCSGITSYTCASSGNNHGCWCRAGDSYTICID